MRRFDGRLLRWGRPTRIYLVATIALGSTRALLVVAQAWLLATIVAGAFTGGKDLGQLKSPMILLLAVVLLRAAAVWSTEVAADRCSARVKSELRGALVRRSAVVGLDGPTDKTSGELAVLATRGIDALDGYYSRYLPQLFLAVIVPLTVVAAVLTADWVSAVIMAVTVPLIPVFMVLVGTATSARSNRQFRTLQILSGHFLDVISGLATLKIFGRSRAQAGAIAEVSQSYRRTTMATLRLAFLSSLVLELLASLSVAMVAVSIGLRVLAGHLDLRSSLFVLVLAPEAYLPLRQVGAEFHASAEGLSAAEQSLAIIDQPEPQRGSITDVPNPSRTGLAVESLRVVYPGRPEPALDGLTVTVDPGEVLAITGTSGCGKSTLLGVLLGFVPVAAGRVCVGDRDLATLDPDAWRRMIAWVPQHPHLFAGSIADNIRVGRSDAFPLDVDQAVSDAGLSNLVNRLSHGLDTRLGERGAGLSAGERQRVALARAFLRDAPLLLLDEPTANLDGQTEADLIDAVARLSAGRTVILVAHRPALVAMADRVVDLTKVGVGR
jgi:thiol reductant ABC exporter CydD subunit